MELLVAAVFAISSSLFTAVALLSTSRFHGRFSMDSQAGVQKLHEFPTPRIGGIPLLVGAAVGGLLLTPEARHLWWLICLSALPAFAAGLIEDITKRVGVKARLIATVLSGLIFCMVSGYSLQRADILGLDWLLGFSTLSLLVSAIAIGGIANALNLIDGVNGLASGTAIIILTGFTLVGWIYDDSAVMGICLVSIGALMGFFLINFPRGRLFLGDAGAYSAGFVLAIIAIILPIRNPELSPLMGLLALAYPVIETLVSIHRRLVREGSNPGQPDRLHLHSLVYRSLSKRISERIGMPRMRNPMTAVLLWFLPLLTSLLMVFVAESPMMITAALILTLAVYIRFYRRVALLRSSKK